MSTIQNSALQSAAFDAKGYLQDFNAWSPELAEALAEEDELELTDCHWEAIRFLREYYSTFDMPPSARTIIKEIGDKLDSRNCNRHTLERLFPKGGCKHACRIAGLPESFCYAC